MSPSSKPERPKASAAKKKALPNAKKPAKRVHGKRSEVKDAHDKYANQEVS